MKLSNYYTRLIEKSTIVNHYFHTRKHNIEKYLVEADGIFYQMKLGAHGRHNFVFEIQDISEARQPSFRILRDNGTLFEITDEKFVEEIDNLDYNFNTNMLNKK